MSIRAALTAGTVLLAAVTAAWALTATATIGPPPPLHLTRDLSGDYAQLARAATGNAVALFAVTAVIYAACFMVSGLRRLRREAAEAREYDRAVRDAEADEHALGWR
jgi:hypothetical protein